jgi:outer membrane receptor protein involved in Fe transport
LLINDAKSFVDQYSFKLDYVIPSFLKSKWGTGLKSSYVKTDNDLRFQGKNEGDAQFKFLTGQSNQFIYREQIHAAYLNTERAIGKFSYQLGLRGEWTVADGISEAYTSNVKDSTFHRDYAQLFPSAFIQYDYSQKHSFGFNYSRRIDRPNYGDLNPFVFFLDNYTFKVGNPMLTPQLTNSIELSHTFLGAFSTTFGYSHTTNVITEILKQDTEARISYQTTANMAERTNYSLGFSLPIPIKKWWTSNTDIYLNRAELEGKVENAALSPARNMFYINTNHIFTLPKDFRFEIGGNYFTGGLESAFVFGAAGALNLGIQKTMLNKRGVLRLNAQDVLFTSNPNVYIKYGDLDIVVRPRQDSRVVRLNFTYRFGNMSIKGARVRATGLDAEKSRVKTK